MNDDRSGVARFASLFTFAASSWASSTTSVSLATGVTGFDCDRVRGKMLADLEAPFSSVEGHYTTHRNVLDQTLRLDVSMLPLSVSSPEEMMGCGPDAIGATWKRPSRCVPVVDHKVQNCRVANLRGILGPSSPSAIIRLVFSPMTDIVPGSRMMPSSTWLQSVTLKSQALPSTC